MYRYARSLTREPSQAQELVQEAYRRALAAKHKPSTASEENLRAWLFTILRNLWHNEVRQQSRWAIGCTTPDSIAICAEPADVQITRALLQSEVRHAIDLLPEPYREVVLHRDIEGLSYAQIARILGCPPGTVMSRLARARAGLRQILSSRAPVRNGVKP